MLRYGCSPMTPNLVGLTSEKHSSSEGFPPRIRICYGLLVKMFLTSIRPLQQILRMHIKGTLPSRKVNMFSSSASQFAKWKDRLDEGSTWENVSTMTTRFLTLFSRTKNLFGGVGVMSRQRSWRARPSWLH